MQISHKHDCAKLWPPAETTASPGNSSAMSSASVDKQHNNDSRTPNEALLPALRF